MQLTSAACFSTQARYRSRSSARLAHTSAPVPRALPAGSSAQRSRAAGLHSRGVGLITVGGADGGVGVRIPSTAQPVELRLHSASIEAHSHRFAALAIE